MHRRRSLSLALAAFLSLSTLAPGVARAAEERGTREEAKAMADAAYDYIKKVGPEAAYKAFTTDKATWTRKDLYVIVLDNKGPFLAHGANEKLVGRDMINVRDASGKLISAAMLEMVNKGGGWVDYDWAHPQTRKVEPKTSYVRKTPAGDAYLGVGVYR